MVLSLQGIHYKLKTENQEGKPHVIEEFFCGSDRQSLLSTFPSLQLSYPLLLYVYYLRAGSQEVKERAVNWFYLEVYYLTSQLCANFSLLNTGL